MLNRWIGILSAAGMILVNVAILRRDVLPDWFASDPPPSEAQLLTAGQMRVVQVGIYDGDGRKVGASWTRSRRTSFGGLVAVLTTTVLEPLSLPGGVNTPRVRVETEVTYHGRETRVDELDFKIHGLGLPIGLHGESMLSGEFPCRWQVGDEFGVVVLDSRAPTALGDVIRPFDRLPELYVGRSWRLELLDPLAHIVPKLETVGLALEPVLIKVVDQKIITHQGEEVDAFVVQGAGATAWVAHDGRVLRQEVNIPLVGQLVLLDEPYDDEARIAAVRSTSRSRLAPQSRGDVEAAPP